MCMGREDHAFQDVEIKGESLEHISKYSCLKTILIKINGEKIEFKPGIKLVIICHMKTL